MSSALTTAMLALPNDSYGRGVVACYPMEEASGTTVADVSTTSNASLALNWRGIWSSSNSYNPRDVVVLASGSAQAYVCTAPIAVGGMTPGALASQDLGNWNSYGSVSTWMGNWTSGTNYALNNLVISSNGMAYKCTAAITNSTVAPQSDTSHWAQLITSYSVGHGNNLALGAGTPAAAPGASALISDAAASWSIPTSISTTGIPFRGVTRGDPFCSQGTSASTFIVFKMPTTAIPATGALFLCGAMTIRILTNGIFTAYVTCRLPGSTGTTTIGITGTEKIQPGVHTAEVRWDGYAAHLIMDGDLVGWRVSGLNANNSTPVPLDTAANVTGVGGAYNSVVGVQGVQVSHFMFMNRALDRDEHRALARLADVVSTTEKMPLRNRSKDVYNTADQAAATLTRGCIYCGGKLTNNEEKITFSDSRLAHAGCAVLSRQVPFNTSSSYSEIAASMTNGLVAGTEIYSTGWQNYHDGTRFYASTDGWGGTQYTTFPRSWSWVSTLAVTARKNDVPANHWIWQYCRQAMEQAILWQVGGPGLPDGATSQAMSFPGGGAAYGAIAPNVQVSAGKPISTDYSYTTFMGAQLATIAVAMKPYLQQHEPATWARWYRFFTAMGEFLTRGYTNAPPTIPVWQYVPNGNFCLNQASAMLGVYRVTDNQKWYDQYKIMMDFAINPIKNYVDSSVLQYRNALGGFNPRGFWSPGKTYNPGDRVGIPYNYGNPTRTMDTWKGDWSSGTTYQVGDRVKDTVVTSGTSMYFIALNNITSPTTPSQDATNWLAEGIGDWREYICSSRVTNSSIRPDLDTAHWSPVSLPNNRTYRTGFYGIGGTAGSDTDLWTDYKCYLNEWAGTASLFRGVPGEMQGLPGYDGDYTLLQMSILENMFILAGGFRGPHPSVNNNEWKRIVRLLNGYTNQIMQYTNLTTYVVTTTTDASGGYSTRNNTTNPLYTTYPIAAIAAGTRPDLAATYPALTPYNWANLRNLNTAVSNLANWSSNAYGVYLGQMGVFTCMDPNAKSL